MHTEHVKGLASYKLTQARHFGWVRSWLRQKRLKSGFLSAQRATNRGTMDHKRSRHSCRHLLVTQTLPLGQTFCPSTLLKPHSYSCRSLSKGYTHMISQCWEGPLCAETSPASQSYLFPNFLAGEEATSRPGPHNHECPSQAPILTS